MTSRCQGLLTVLQSAMNVLLAIVSVMVNADEREIVRKVKNSVRVNI
jgi:hypothetical protein